MIASENLTYFFTTLRKFATARYWNKKSVYEHAYQNIS